MKKASLILTILVLVSLLLAACGAEEPTNVPNTSAPPATGASTSTSETTATEAPTTTAATTSTSEANAASTPGIPVTGGNNPSQRITSLIGSPVCGMGGDQLGTVQDMVLDFNQVVVTYMIVDANGKSVAIPYSFLIKPRANGMGTGSGTGAGSGTGNSGTGTQATGTPSAGGTGAQSTDTPSAGGTGTLATDTPSAGLAASTATSTTGTGSSSGTGATAQQNCLKLSMANDIFTNAPAFDSSVMPETGQPALDWDTDIMEYWVTGGAPEATSTPSAGGETDTTATATPAPGLKQFQSVILASDLLGANFVMGPQGTGTGTGSGAGTGNSLGTSTPSAGGSSTAVPDTTATASSGNSGSGTGTTVTDNSQGSIQDVIIDPRIGKLQYLVVSLGSADNWIPVPVSLLGWDAINNQVGLMADASMLQNAPSFSSSQFPDVSMSGWGQQFSSYWSGGGTGSESGSGTGTTATATP